MRKGKIYKLIILIMIMGIIYYFSSQNASVSSQTSNDFLRMIYDLLKSTINISYDHFMNNFASLIRELAHLFEFLVLGVVSYWYYIDVDKINANKLAILCCFVYSLFDEIHQLFVPGRAFQLLDLLIDGCGYIFGIMMMHFVYNKCLKK